VHQALLGTCTNSTLADLETAAEIVKGRTISKNVRMYVVPGTRKIYLEALKSGLIEIFMDAGCTILNPGCGPCVGMHQGLLAPGEVAISSSNRNFKGRMGSPEAEIYLASPATVAASAVSGVITDPRKVS
jgi:homoaconitase/3-isopropylmalate dehydratase large subunit